MRAPAVALALLLSGCSVGPLFEDAQPSPDPRPEPDYKAIVASDVARRFAAAPLLRPNEIAGLRRSTPAQPGDWVVCVKGVENNEPAFYAAFIQDHKVVDFRQSVLIDGCIQEHFERLPEPKKP